jgi:hypothetical protein
MTRTSLGRVLALVLVLGSVSALRADVKTEEKNLVTFSGALGRLVNLFGGKAAKEGVVSAVAVAGDRKMTLSDTGGQIVDLREEKVYDLDVRRKTYTVTTFAELRKRMQEAQAKAEREAQQSREPAEKDKNAKEMEVDFSVKNTGQTRTINGFDTRQMIVTVTVREKGKTLEQSGGLVLTADSWLTRTVPALKEIADFDARYASRLQGPMAGMSADQMATALAMYPGLKEAFAKYQGERVDGTPILTIVTIESVRSPEQAQQQSTADNSPQPSSIGGMLGGFGKRLAKKPETKEGDQASDSNRATFMTTNHEVLKISTSVAAADVAIPVGFKER